MATKAEVKDEAIVMLGVMELGGTIDSTDSTRMDQAYAEVFADLKKSGLDTWPVAGTIPDDIKPHLSALMATNALDTYHVPDSKFNRILLRAKVAGIEIPRLSVPDYESLDEPRDY